MSKNEFGGLEQSKFYYYHIGNRVQYVPQMDQEIQQT